MQQLPNAQASLIHRVPQTSTLCGVCFCKLCLQGFAEVRCKAANTNMQTCKYKASVHIKAQIQLPGCIRIIPTYTKPLKPQWCKRVTAQLKHREGSDHNACKQKAENLQTQSCILSDQATESSREASLPDDEGCGCVQVAPSAAATAPATCRTWTSEKRWTPRRKTDDEDTRLRTQVHRCGAELSAGRGDVDHLLRAYLVRAEETTDELAN